MYKYKAGLQLHGDEPEYILEIFAHNSDEARETAESIYLTEKNFSRCDTANLVLWDEENISMNAINTLQYQRRDLAKKIGHLYQTIALYKNSKKQITRQIKRDFPNETI